MKEPIHGVLSAFPPHSFSSVHSTPKSLSPSFPQAFPHPPAPDSFPIIDPEAAITCILCSVAYYFI